MIMINPLWWLPNTVKHIVDGHNTKQDFTETPITRKTGQELFDKWKKQREWNEKIKEWKEWQAYVETKRQKKENEERKLARRQFLWSLINFFKNGEPKERK